MALIASGNLWSNLLLICKEEVTIKSLFTEITPDVTELLNNLEFSNHKGVYN